MNTGAPRFLQIKSAECKRIISYHMNLDWVDTDFGFVAPWNSMRNAYWANSWRHAHLPANKNGEAEFIGKGFDGQTIDVSAFIHQMPFMNQAQLRHATEEISYVTNESAWYVNLYQSAAGSWRKTWAECLGRMRLKRISTMSKKSRWVGCERNVVAFDGGG